MTTETGATQTGVPDDPNVRMDRNAAMNAMANRRREVVAKEMEPEDAAILLATPREVIAAHDPATGLPIKAEAADDPEDTDSGDDVAAAARAKLEQEAAAKTEQAPILDPVKQASAQTDDLILSDEDLKHVKIRVVVNGVESFKTGEEVLRDAQKTSAADEYLATAKDLLKEVKGQAKATPAAPAASTPTDTPADPDALDKAVDQLFQGNDVEAKKLFKVALGGGTPTNVDAATREIEQRIVIRSALRQFTKDHKDITADPRARRLADEFLQEELVNNGVSRLEDLPADIIPDVLDRAGTRTKDYFREKAGIAPSAPAVTGNTANTLRDRLARKETIDELPTAATRSSSTVAPPQTTTDVINRMRAARGQSVPG